MARVLKNELSWSRSRISTLDACARRYYYQYYLKWGGWDASAPVENQLAYRLSKMTSLPMICGLAVHDTIKRILEEVRDHGRVLTSDPAVEARHAMTKVWRDAAEEKWRSSVKWHPPVFELYYGEATPPAVLKKWGAKAARCVRAFLESDLFRELRDEPSHDWLAVDDGPSFDAAKNLRIEGRTVWALPDFARRTQEGDCEIWDWKTGSPSPHDAQQLQSYALYARDLWGCPTESIRLMAFYLDSGKITEYPSGAAELEEIENRIRADFRRMESLLVDVDGNRPRDAADFEGCADPAVCRRCFFNEICDVAAAAPGETAAYSPAG